MIDSRLTQVGGFNLGGEFSTGDVVGRALGCVYGRGSLPEVQSSLEGMLRLFLEEYRNRCRNDDVPQVELRFDQISPELLLNVFAPTYGFDTKELKSWFSDYLEEHEKALADLMALQRASWASHCRRTYSGAERMRFLDSIALLTSLPAPKCSLCQESLFQSCMTCHHSCVSGRIEDNRNNKKRSTEPEQSLLIKGASTPPNQSGESSSPSLSSVPEVQLHVLSATSGENLTAAIPDSLSSISSDFSNERSPTIREHSMENNNCRGRRSSLKRLAVPLAPLPVQHTTASARQDKKTFLMGSSMVCVNCRSHFTCALQSRLEKVRPCGGLLLLSRYSLSQMSLLIVMLIERMVGKTPDVSSMQLTRLVHRFPRLIDLADLSKATSLQLKQWDIQVARAIVHNDLHTPRQFSQDHTSIPISASASGETFVSEEISTSPMNESAMEKLSTNGAEVLNYLSWAYFCAAGHNIISSLRLHVSSDLTVPSLRPIIEEPSP